MSDPASDLPRSTATTRCVVVGGGPGGVVFSLLLARAGVPVTLLESHHDFDRDFRGDTIHPSTLEALDQIGLADGLLAMPHGLLRDMTLATFGRAWTLADFRSLPTRFPYVMLLPQAQFLDYLASAARKYPTFQIVFGANVQRLVEENGSVRGVRYRDPAGDWHEVRADLTVAADGRFSKLRSLGGFDTVKTSPPMDVLWFRVPHQPGDPSDAGWLFVGGGHMLVLIDRGDFWQLGYFVPKGGFSKVKAAGLPELQTQVARFVPWLRERLEQVNDWRQISVLSVESSRVTTWHKPGLLLIGDAAHVMTPVGGVGINYAVQDAIEASNLLAEPLRTGKLTRAHLAAVQRARQFPTQVIQAFQRTIQRIIITEGLASDKPFTPPLPLRLLLRVPLLKTLPARMVAFGIKRVRVRTTEAR